MSLVTLTKLQHYKLNKKPFVGLSLYDATFSRLANDASMDFILIGDSLGQAVQGHDSTLPVLIEQMVYHTAAVSKVNQHCFLISDMPYLSYTNTKDAIRNAALLMKAGAHMIKLEGGHEIIAQVRALSQAGIPVCGHIGLMPQHVHQLGGYKVQGKTAESQQKLYDEAIALQEAGVKLLVLECMPTSVAADITAMLTIPSIGIGAGCETDGQILVAYDCLGLTQKTAKFVKHFYLEATTPLEALCTYRSEVSARQFPAPEHSYD